MIQYPVFVYRKALEKREDGSAFDTLLVSDDEGKGQALKSGWHDDVVSALTRTNIDKSVDDVDFDSPPTRAELEGKANELGIKFDGRTTDRKLCLLIAEALGE